ncbi:zinc finger MYM-type protein 1-like isoform X2 [Homarus americanus]|uniref:zinc finger MYM-type protein 1-like isoform X2 n=1 Tax=Homarus americanus TaxID=6706 RepID=UPI001C47FD4F|nr:zinc finger MYM-type protein 1-like isoform X2 [Homarus americanus]
MYMINDWLAGCSSAQRVYCWACLLFSNDKNVWNTYGYNDLSNVHKAVKKHSLSESHLKAVISEKTFGKARIDYMLSDQKRVRDNQHNQLVKRNREIMKRYIDTVCYLAKTEQAFRGHDEATSSVNKGNYVEFIDVLSKYDGQLRGFLDNATTFSGLSNLIQNDLIESVSYVMLDEIKKEIQHAKFISVMLEEATDITNLCQLSYVFRYSLDNKVYERFLGFENVSQDRTAEALYTFVTNLMQKYECESKIVAQTYDGAAVMAGELNGLQSRVKGKYPTALFIHCFAHRLNLVLSQAMAKISKCKVFFMTLNGLSAFFSKSTKRTHALNQEMTTRKLPKVSATRWNYASRLVETVFECKESLIAVFEKMRDPESEWDQESYNRAGGFLSSMTDFNFCFLLNLFASFFPLSDTLFDILQAKIHDVGYCVKKVNDFRLALEQKREEFENIWETTKNCDHINENEPRFKRQKGNVDVKTSFSRLYVEIYDTILNQVNIRFANLDSLRFLELLHSPSFCEFTKFGQFPELAFQSLKCSYDNFFDFLSLKSQLRVVYMSEEFKDKTITEILSFIKLNDLEKAYNEVARLCELILTVPATTASVERSFSALKRIKTYSRNFQGQERLQSLALLSIEKEVLHNLQSKPEFYTKVTDHFARKPRRIPLNYVKNEKPASITRKIRADKRNNKRLVREIVRECGPAIQENPDQQKESLLYIRQQPDAGPTTPSTSEDGAPPGSNKGRPANKTRKRKILAQDVTQIQTEDQDEQQSGPRTKRKGSKEKTSESQREETLDKEVLVQPNTCTHKHNIHVDVSSKGWQVFGIPIKEENSDSDGFNEELQGKIKEIDEIVKEEEEVYCDEEFSCEKSDQGLKVKEDDLDNYV